jgi:hypothetical protein
LLAGAMVKLTEHKSLSHETVRRRLAENDIKPWRKDMWCIPQVDGEYVARMEDVLDLYADARSLIPRLTDIVEAIERIHAVLGDMPLDVLETDCRCRKAIKKDQPKPNRPTCSPSGHRRRDLRRDRRDRAPDRIRGLVAVDPGKRRRTIEHKRRIEGADD